MPTNTSRNVYQTQVLDRVIQILDCFSTETPELLFCDLLGRLKLHKSTLYRLLEAMRYYRLIERENSTGKYHLGLKLFELGSLSIGQLELDKCAHPILEELVKQTGETSHLCVLDGFDVVYISKVESKLTFRIPSTVGRRNPAYCTGVGKAILAYLNEQELEAYLASGTLKRFARNTISSAKELRQNLKLVRSRGYALDNEEISDGVRCIGAPIRNHSGKVIAGISIAGPSIRITKAQIPAMASFVIEAATAVSLKLGFNPENH